MGPDESFMMNNTFTKTYDDLIYRYDQQIKNNRSSTVIRNATRVLKTINSNKDLRQNSKIQIVKPQTVDPYRDSPRRAGFLP